VNLSYLTHHWHHVFHLANQHLQLAGIAMAVAIAVALPLGVLVAAVRPLTLPVYIILGMIYTIPSLAFLAFLIPSLGLGRKPAVVVLAAYAQLALVRNIVTGLRGVDAPILEAARGLGMNPWQVFVKVRLPLALPIVLAGVRIALVLTISLASVMAWINAGGLGSLLFDGVATNNTSQILAGLLAISALALLADALMRLLIRLASGPWTRLASSG
jgi:osmoprotectant transport system permease protein